MTAGVTSAGTDAAALLSRWWSRPVPEEVEGWEEAWPAAALVAADLGLGSAGVEALAAARDAATVEELLDEYERLFVGPGATPCPPYESVWRREDGRHRPDRASLMSATSTEVADLYRRAGLDVAPDARELPDHIAVECEALAWASDAEASPSCADVADSLLTDHLRVWLPGFCAAVEDQSALPFYAALAALTRTWVAALPAPRSSGP